MMQIDASQPLSASLVHTSKPRITVNFDCGKLHTGFIFLGGTSWGVTWFIYLGLFQTGARKLQIILFFGHKSSILPGSPGLVPYEDFQTNPNFDWLNPQLLVGEIRLVSCHFNTFRTPAIVGSPLFEPRQSLANWLRFMPRKGKRAVGGEKGWNRDACAYGQRDNFFQFVLIVWAFRRKTHGLTLMTFG